MEVTRCQSVETKGGEWEGERKKGVRKRGKCGEGEKKGRGREEKKGRGRKCKDKREKRKKLPEKMDSPMKKE